MKNVLDKDKTRHWISKN